MTKPEHYIPLKLAVAALAVSPQTFDRTYRRRLPAAAVRTAGGRVSVHLRTLINQLVADAEAAAVARTATPDGLLAGPASPAQERFRRARAEREELELRQARLRAEREAGEWVSRETVVAAARRWGEALRGVRRGLLQRYGREAAALVDEALDAMQTPGHELNGDGRWAAEETGDA